MKIMKKLSAFLAAVMTISMLVVPVSATDEWNAGMSDDFESYADNAALGAVWKDVQNGGMAIPEIVSDNGSKVMKFTRTSTQSGDNNMMARKLEKEITNGEVVYKSKFKIKNANNGSFLVGIRDKTGKQNMNFVYLSKDGMYSNTTWAGGINLGYPKNSVDDKWFEVEAKINMDTHKYDIMVWDGTKEYTSKECPMVQVGTSTNITDIGEVFIQTWGGSNGTAEVYFDDVSVSVPKPAEPADPWFSDDFESYADNTALGAVWKDVQNGGMAIPEIVSDNGSKVMKFTRTSTQSGDNNMMARKLEKEITNGEVVYKSKFKIKNANNGSFLVGIRDKTGKQNMNFVYLSKDGMYSNTTWAGGINLGYPKNSVDDKWFEVEAKINMDTHKYDIMVWDGTKEYTSKECPMVQVGTSTNITDIGEVFIQTWGGSNGVAEVYFDDVSVSEYKEPEPEDPSVVIGDDFESYANTAMLRRQWKNAYGDVEAELAETDGVNGGKALKLSRTSVDNNMLKRALKTPITSGKVIYKGKFKVEYGTTAPIFHIGLGDSKNKYLSFVFLTQSGMYTNTDWNNSSCEFDDYSASASQAGKWFEIEAAIDMDTKKYDVSVTVDGFTYTKMNRDVKAIGGNVEFADISSLFVQTYSGSDGAIYVDDLSINYVLEPINVEASNISIVKANGEETALAGTVSASTSVIKIDFGTAVRENTLTDKTVVLKNVTDDKTVAYTGALNGNVYAMTLSKLLEPGKNYQLILTKDIKTLAGGTLEDNKSFAFAADNGECAISLIGAKVGGNTTPTVADFKAAQTANVSVKIVNSTNEDKEMLIIAAYYKNGEMTGVTYKPVTLAKSEYENMTAEITIDLPANAEADNVKIFAWDKITSMIPYGTNLEF